MKILSFTFNSKTLLSVDFDRESTCLHKCPWCYCNNMERLYPLWKIKIRQNSIKAKETPKQFAQQLNLEYSYLINSKQRKLVRLSKIPIRIYGSGDYIFEHLEFLKNLNFKHFIISKNLTTGSYINEIEKLLQYDYNLTSLVLSFYASNIENYKLITNYIGFKKIKLAYTGMPDEFNEIKHKYKFNIFFNVSKKKSERAKSRLIKEQCPCDSGLLAHNESCTFCNKCWR